MKPITKYQGGKTREIPLIETLKPKIFSRVLEPFCGGAAVSFHYDNPSVLNDLNCNLINLYEVVRGSEFPLLLHEVLRTKEMDHDELEKVYYESRELINSEDGSSLERAYSFIVIKQLAFSGMERYNSEGKFNVPFGHYKKFSCQLSPSHHEFLKKCELSCGDAIEVLERAKEDDFVFLDPPYLDRLGYESGDGGEMHVRLVRAMKECQGQWMFIHSDHKFYREELGEFVWYEKDFKYAQNFGKGKDHSGSKVKHIYVRNYE